jgi:2'-5' RNA ligase
MRLFIGIKAGCGQHLAALQGALKKMGRGRFTHADNIHITLKFLGELPTSSIPVLRDAIDEAGGCAFELECGGARLFNRGGIVSAEVAGDTEQLSVLHACLEAALERRGFARDTRAFRPHITLARDYKTPGDAAIENIPHGRCRFTVSEVVLFESRREGGRLVYAPLYAHELQRR